VVEERDVDARTASEKTAAEEHERYDDAELAAEVVQTVGEADAVAVVVAAVGMRE
jgi:hypothetical protein